MSIFPDRRRRSGKCLEIVLPGQQTRYHTVEGGESDGQLERPLSLRTAPLAGTEAMLRQYIEGVGRGQPDYDRMTSEMAAQTRQQLPSIRPLYPAWALRPIRSAASSAMGNDLHRPFCQRLGGMADWPREERHDRPDRAGSAVAP